jgi:hypothetical protein
LDSRNHRRPLGNFLLLPLGWLVEHELRAAEEPVIAARPAPRDAQQHGILFIFGRECHDPQRGGGSSRYFREMGV